MTAAFSKNDNQSFRIAKTTRWLHGLQITMVTLEVTEIIVGPNPTADFIQIDIGAQWLREFDTSITDIEVILRVQTRVDNNNVFFDYRRLKQKSILLNL